MDVLVNDKLSSHTWKSGGYRIVQTLRGEQWRRLERPVSVSTPACTRHFVDAEVVAANRRSVRVRLPDGNVVKRKLGRDYQED